MKKFIKPEISVLLINNADCIRTSTKDNIVSWPSEWTSNVKLFQTKQ